MRNVIRPILFAGAAALVPALAMSTPAGGFIATGDCSATAPNLDSDNAELYTLKIALDPAARTNDMLWDLRQKGEGQSDVQAQLDLGLGQWSVGDTWALSQIASDMAFSFVTFANGTVYMDSNDGAAVDWGASPVHVIGNSPDVGIDAGTNLTIPGDSTQFQAMVRPGTPKSFPVRAEARPAGSGTFAGINIAFAPLPEVNPNDGTALAPDVCDIGGLGFNPQDPTRGAIIGYNVYRMPGSAGTPPTRAQFDAAARTPADADGGWVYFLDLRRFDVTLADTNPGADGTDAPSDTTVSDLTGLQNPDARMYSGDEVVIFQDSASRAGVPRVRATQLAPDAATSYWYAVQPVIFGDVDQFANVDFTSNGVLAGDHRMDLDGDGEFDAVSLNTVGTHDSPEFISFQNEAGNGGVTTATVEDGLGLTNGGLLLLSPPMFANAAVALPATGQVRLSGSVTGNDVNLQFTTGLERGNVMGYNVYRVAGDSRVRVNEQPILAQGNESNVYSVVDVATRARGARSADYMVEIVYSDGTASTMVGPFSVSLDQAPARRRR